MKKICNNCEIEKEISEFYITKEGKTKGKFCKICFRQKYKSNKETKSKYYEMHKAEILSDMKVYYKLNKKEIKEKYKEYYSLNKDKIKKSTKEYYEVNKKKLNKENVSRVFNRRNSDPLYKLIRNIRSLIYVSLKSRFTEKSKKTIEILGCSFQEFSQYLESKFDENMSWDNQGSYWHIDHIKPISLAKSEEEVYELNHYTNFQPLYWKDNLMKGNKF